VAEETPADVVVRAAQALALPLQRALDVRPIDADDPASGVWFRVGELADNGAGGLHAAALGAALEVAGFLAVLPTLAAAEHAVTHMISTQLVAAARAGERVDVRGTLLRRTRNLAFVTVDAEVGDRLVARSQLTKSVLRR
jgi:acyl-coenzyme A thioesterase PaaI-like protein